jgi:hypothetical protein
MRGKHVMPMVARIARGLLLSALIGAGSPAHAASTCPRAEVHVFKSDGQLVLRCAGKERLRVPVTFGAQPKGHKQRSGDERTPEGRYRVCIKHRSRLRYMILGLS